MAITPRAVNISGIQGALANLGEIRARNRAMRDERRAARGAFLGTVVGGVGGFVASGGNPLGASIGAGIGAQLGRGAFGGRVSGAQIAQTGFQAAAFSQQQNAMEAAAAERAADKAALSRAGSLAQGTPEQTSIDPMDFSEISTPAQPGDLNAAATSLLQSNASVGTKRAGLAALLNLRGQDAATQRAVFNQISANARNQANITSREGIASRGNLSREKIAAGKLAAKGGATGNARPPTIGTTRDRPLGNGIFQREIVNADGVFEKFGEPFRPKSGDKPFRDTAYINTSKKGEIPNWKPIAIRTNKQLDDLIKKRGVENVSLEDPRIGLRANQDIIRSAKRRDENKPEAQPIQQPTAKDIIRTSKGAAGGVKPGSAFAAIRGGGIGAQSNIAAIIDSVKGGLGLGGFAPDVQKARQNLKIVNSRIIQALVRSGRFPKFEVEELRDQLPNPDKFFKNPATAESDLIQIRANIAQRMEINKNAIASGKFSPSTEGEKLEKNLIYKEVLDLIGPPPTDQPTSQSFIPKTRNEILVELSKLFERDTGRMGLDELKEHNEKIRILRTKL